jgi:uncharacterized protein YcbK (DUF882 family)
VIKQESQEVYMAGSIWSDLGKLLLSFLVNKTNESAPVETKAPEPTEKQEVDWTNPDCKVSKYFTVKEMIYLPTWKRMANETDGLNDQIKENLINLAMDMDIVRDYFDKPINVHVTYRPLEYNKAIGGALHSAHSEGEAMDFDIVGMTCDEVREELVSKNLLDKWGMRCEKAPGSNCVHLDYRQLAAGGNRYFIP